MPTDNAKAPSAVLYEPDERLPPRLHVGLGIQNAFITIPSIVLIPAVVVRAGGGTEAFLGWSVFTAVLISGVTTILQTVGVGKVGARYPLIMGTSGAFIPICVAALSEGGPGLLATLVVVSSLFQFIFALRLHFFRSILTPTVTGTVVMLIAVTVMPIFLDMLNDVPEGTQPERVALTSLVALLSMVLIALKAKGVLRFWSLRIGIVVGIVMARLLGFFDIERLWTSPWIGLPPLAWPGVDLQFDASFWGLLPAFIGVTMVGAIETIGNAIAIQQVSWRQPRAINFQTVQGALAADGVGNLLSGCLGTVPNTTYSNGVSMVELTGIATRGQGAVLGGLLILLAFSPKALAFILRIPNSVIGAYGIALLSILFVAGIKLVMQDGIDYRKSLIVGIAFWIGIGFENDMILPAFSAEFAGGLLHHGMTSGMMVVILLTLFDEWSKPRRRSIEMDLNLASLNTIKEFLGRFTARSGWDAAMSDRLTAAAEETLLTLLNYGKDETTTTTQPTKRLLMSAQRDNDGIKLEFFTTTDNENLQMQIAMLADRVDVATAERDVSLRLLNHIADSVHHQQYYDTDIVTVYVRNQQVTKPSLI